ncbi:D-tagatose-1,6-bisphosphate aldolase subunit GatY [Mesomycoplasma dispar]|uniref:D-tagatose-1,6-bisphosphate aldolase subunit GatY n=1 Tax=Mesomycoplasma dispar TaxID=86660 RepID=A0AAJ5NSD1_9BACT|nr:ketose-bisphosphate aldolase [Mesomycoplasma dispar]AJR12337.1 fructose-bisphosphate aldolase [Mesomycoplasma dispar]VEU62166.1 D-tagatose-1,6-bisphosphate aldolase subunit GatY [Mesomycoplasma dispar]
MALIDPKSVFLKLNAENKAIFAFNVLNLETLLAVIKAGEISQKPLIIQLSQGAIKYSRIEFLASMILSAIKNSSGQFIFHLDHCDDLELFQKYLEFGFNSAMFDGSKLEISENIEKSLKAKTLASKKNVFLELEIGQIGGKEIGYQENSEKIIELDVVKEFYEKTKPDLLAIAFGTAHGIYQKKAVLDWNLVKNFKKYYKIPLVMHGSSGLSREEIEKAINLGINKINVGTDLLVSFSNEVKKYFQENPNAYDIRKINQKGIEKMIEKVLFYLELS